MCNKIFFEMHMHLPPDCMIIFYLKYKKMLINKLCQLSIKYKVGI